MTWQEQQLAIVVAILLFTIDLNLLRILIKRHLSNKNG